MIVGFAVTIVALGFCAAAFADGAATIADAPSIVSGVSETGDNSTTGTDGIHNDFWLLQLIAGDRITVDWQQYPPARLELDVYPIGTNDYNLASIRPVHA